MTKVDKVSSADHFFGLTAMEVDSRTQNAGLPSYRGRQLRDWVYQKLVIEPDEMTTFSAAQKIIIGRLFSFLTAQVERRQDSDDGTVKLLLKWPDGQMAETVMLSDGNRRTACISSQVGCPVGCRFCASGIEGLKGNLSAGRIVEQVIQLNLLLKPEKRTITNIVLMGMGEPLANYHHVIKALQVLHDPGCMNIGARRITLSTVGVPRRILDLADEKLPINLAISLHAPNENLRRELIPWAEHFSLDDILSAAKVYFQKTGREITLEYILLSGVNDRVRHAEELAEVAKSLRANVNLIRYNEVSSLPFSRPDDDDVLRFQNVLRQQGINAHIRKSRGRDIDAACGQLRRTTRPTEEI